MYVSVFIKIFRQCVDDDDFRSFASAFDAFNKYILKPQYIAILMAYSAYLLMKIKIKLDAKNV